MSNHRTEIVTVAAILLIVAALVDWFQRPTLTGTVDEPDSLRCRLRAWVWPADIVREPEVVIKTGLMLPDRMEYPPHCIPPSTPYPLPKEKKQILEARQAAQNPPNDSDPR